MPLADASIIIRYVDICIKKMLIKFLKTLFVDRRKSIRKHFDIVILSKCTIIIYCGRIIITITSPELSR